MASDIKHWHLNATVYKDRVEEIHYISDPARNVRRKQQREVWVVEQFLGRGGFGEVSLQRNNEAGKARAVKRIAGAGAAMNHNDFEKELKALLEFSKPKYKEAAVFVEFFGWFKDGADVFLAMEYMPLGDLEKYVVARSGKIPEVEARNVAEQIMFGLEIMHAESFAHRDLKPQNVLVVHGSPEWWVKLADFGLSKRLTDATGYHTRAGTQAYMAPEVQNLIESGVAGSDYTNAVDMWAVGCITYRLVTGVVPFPPGRTLMKYCEDKSLFPYDALFDSGIKSTCSKFIRHLLVAQPQERPSATQALQHEWIGVSTNIERRPSIRQQAQKAQQQQAFQPSQSAITEVDYNTVSHEGLKSYQSQSSDAYSSPQTSASNVNLSSASGSTTITPGALPPNPEAAVGVADGGLGKVELLHTVSSLLSKSSSPGGTRGPPGPPPPLPYGWAAEWSEHFQKWWFFSKHASEPEAPRWNIPTEPVGPSEEDGATNEGTSEADEEEEEEDMTDSEVRRKEQFRAHSAQRSGGIPMPGPAPPKKESTPIEKRPVEEEMTSPRAPPVPMIPFPGPPRVRSPEVGWFPGKAGTDAMIFVLVTPSKAYPDGRAAVVAHYSDKTDESYIVERVSRRLKLPLSSDGKVVMSWVPDEGGEMYSQRFAVWPDEKGLADVVFTTRVGENGNETVPKIYSFPDSKPYSFNTLREDMASNMPKASQSPPKYAVEDITGPEVPRPTERVVAIYTFDSNEPGDLTFTKGDVIEILSLANEHWYKGRLDKREGILPANYVEVLPVLTTAELDQANITKVRALFNYDLDLHSFQLPLKKYEILKLIRPLGLLPEAWYAENALGRQGGVLLKHVATESQYQKYVFERLKTKPVEGHTIERTAPHAGLREKFKALLGDQPFDMVKYQEKVNGTASEQLQEQWENYTRSLQERTPPTGLPTSSAAAENHAQEKEAKKATPKGENAKSKGFIHSLKKFL